MSGRFFLRKPLLWLAMLGLCPAVLAAASAAIAVRGDPQRGKSVYVKCRACHSRRANR